jgi:hypothetical protein
MICKLLGGACLACAALCLSLCFIAAPVLGYSFGYDSLGDYSSFEGVQIGPFHVGRTVYGSDSDIQESDQPGMVLAASPARKIIPKLEDSKLGADPDLQPSTVMVPLTVSNGFPQIEVTLNGKGPFTFLVHPGAPATGITRKLASELGLESRKEEDSTDDLRRVVIDDLAIGTANFESVSAIVWNPSDYFGPSADASGVVGFSLFENHLVFLDFPNDRLAIVADDHLRNDKNTVVPYEVIPSDMIPGGGHQIMIPAQVASREMNLEINFFSSGKFLFPLDLMEKLPLASEPGVIGMIRNEEGTFTIQGSSLNGDVELAGYSLNNPGVRFTEATDTSSIGFGALSEFRIVIDQTNKLMQFRRAAGASHEVFRQAANVQSLEKGGTPLRAAFNADRDLVRMLLILSPT